MSVKIERLERLRAKIAALPEAMKQEVFKALNVSADEMVTMAQRLAPVKDGVLRNSIRKRAGRTELSVEVVAGGAATTKAVRKGTSATYDYALGQEFGTSDMAANPFFFPSFRANKKRSRSRVTRAATKAAKQVASRS